jgi:hypothetical protein
VEQVIRIELAGLWMARAVVDARSSVSTASDQLKGKAEKKCPPTSPFVVERVTRIELA